MYIYIYIYLYIYAYKLYYDKAPYLNREKSISKLDHHLKS